MTDHKTPQRLAWILIAIVTLVLFFRHLSHFDLSSGQIPQDFSVYVKAVERVHVGLSPYQPTELFTYKYSPGALALFYLLPAGMVPSWLAAKAVYLLLWAAAVSFSLRIRTWKDVGLLVAGLALSWKGLLEALDFGQFEFILLFCGLVGSSLMGSIPWIAGFLCASLPWFKLPWGLAMAPFFIVALQGGPRTFLRWCGGTALATIVWALLIPGVLFGFSNTLNFTREWLHVLRTQPTSTLLGEPANQSIWAVVHRISGGGTGAMVFSLVMVLILVVIGWTISWRRARTETPGTWMNRWFLLTILANPLSWSWGSLLLIGLPLSVDWGGVRKSTGLSVALTAAVGAFLLQQKPAAVALFSNRYMSLYDFGLILFFWLALFALSAGTISDDSRRAGSRG